MRVGADHGGSVQALHQGALEFVRDEVATLRIHAFLQSVFHLRSHGILMTGGVPERLLIGVRGTASLGIHRLGGRRLLCDGGVHRAGQLGVHRLQTLHAANLLAEVGDVVFHAGVNGIVLFRQEAVGIAVGLQKRLGSRQLLGTLVAKFDNSHGIDPPQFFKRLSRSISSATERPCLGAGSCCGAA